MSEGERVNNLVVISDLHCGCAMGLIHADGVALDDGGYYIPSDFQRAVWHWYQEFWVWVEQKTHGEPFDLVCNGDALQGKPHSAIHQVSDNYDVQLRIAHKCLEEPVRKARRYYHIRGTEAHGGKSLQYEEILARELGAEPTEQGLYARYELNKLIGRSEQGILVNCMHHVGTTGRQHYESTAVLGELVEAYVEAGRWHDRAPDCVVRSHRHRNLEVKIPTANSWGVSVVTPGWQGRTPFAAKVAGARQSQPQFGGVLIREAPDGVWYSMPWVRSLSRGEPEV